MAASTQFAAPVSAATPLALWHLLSLDAPTIAALWTWFVARAVHVDLPIAAPIAMALAVWILYAADRLLDARLMDARSLASRILIPWPKANATRLKIAASPQDTLEARHFYHHRHRSAFLSAIAAAALVLAALLPGLAPAALRLYLVEGALLLVWFLVIHASHNAHRLPKEIAVGLFFSAAVFIPTIAREPGLRAQLLPCAVLFATLCSLNCLFIYAWEHRDPRPANQENRHAGTQLPHLSTRIALTHLIALNMTVTISAIALAILHSRSSTNAGEKLLSAACAISAALLLLLHRNREHLSRVHLRAAADLTLLTPLVLLPFLR